MVFTMEVPDEAAIKKQIEETVTTDIDESPKREDVLPSFESFGADLIKSSVAKNSLLQMKIRSLAKDGNEGGLVAKGLMDLQRELQDLDPSLIDFAPTGILGKLFDPVRSYFAKYQKQTRRSLIALPLWTKGEQP
jgi:uncharacterized protein YaaN involved in tellurite resistance